MDATAGAGFCTESSVVVIAGKGGVGKSTLSATLARLAVRSGLSVLLIELEERGGSSRILGHDALTSDEVELSVGGTDDQGSRSASIRARTITPDGVLVEYLVDHGFGGAARRLAKSGMLDVAATAIPGVRDVLALSKMVQLEQSHTADLIVVDGPAAGHVITFLTSAQGLLDSSGTGPIRTLCEDVVRFLADPARCRVVLVTLAEETPVNETVETAFALQDRAGTHLGPLIVNCLYPQLEHLDADPAAVAAAAGITLRNGEADALRAAAAFRRRRQEMQAVQATRLAEALPLPQLRLPDLFAADIDLPEIDLLVDALESELRGLRQPIDRADSTDSARPGSPIAAPGHDAVGSSPSS